MTDNTIIDKLARTIERVELGKDGKALPFVYADLDTQNILLDNVGAPFAAAAPLSSGMVQDEHGRFHERATFEIFFGDLMAQSLSDYDARENERIIDECKMRAFAWLSSFRPANELRLISVNSATRTYLQFDAIVTGFMLNVTLEEIKGYDACDYHNTIHFLHEHAFDEGLEDAFFTNTGYIESIKPRFIPAVGRSVSDALRISGKLGQELGLISFVAEHKGTLTIYVNPDADDDIHIRSESDVKTYQPVEGVAQIELEAGEYMIQGTYPMDMRETNLYVYYIRFEGEYQI